MEKEKLYEIAKRIISNTIRKLIRNNPQLLEQGNMEEIEVQTEALLIKQLTAKVKISVDLSDDTEQIIQHTMQVFDKEFDKLYRECVPEKHLEKQEETDEHISAKKEQEDLEI